MAQGVSYWPLTMGDQVQSQVCPCGTEQVSLQVLQFSQQLTVLLNNSQKTE